jgi:uncharacterized protein YdhG (YjbR/CyaY superfamily)
MNANKLNNVDDYIASFPVETQELLTQIRNTIKKMAPQAEETISYSMPTFKLNGNLVYYAAFKNHIGFYALPQGNEAFKKELQEYKTGKGSIQFPIDKPLPLDLIKRIVEFRVKENLEKIKAKAKKEIK